MRKCYIILTENCFSGQNSKNSTGFSVTVKFDEFVFIYSMKFHVKKCCYYVLEHSQGTESKDFFIFDDLM